MLGPQRFRSSQELFWLIIKSFNKEVKTKEPLYLRSALPERILIILPELLERIPAGFTIRDWIGIDPAATGVLIEVIARINAEVSGPDDVRSNGHALGTQADAPVLRVVAYGDLGRARGALVNVIITRCLTGGMQKSDICTPLLQVFMNKEFSSKLVKRNPRDP